MAQEDPRQVQMHVEHTSLVLHLDTKKFCRVLGKVISDTLQYSPAGGAIRFCTLGQDIHETPWCPCSDAIHPLAQAEAAQG